MPEFPLAPFDVPISYILVANLVTSSPIGDGGTIIIIIFNGGESEDRLGLGITRHILTIAVSRSSVLSSEKTSGLDNHPVIPSLGL